MVIEQFEIFLKIIIACGKYVILIIMKINQNSNCEYESVYGYTNSILTKPLGPIAKAFAYT